MDEIAKIFFGIEADKLMDVVSEAKIKERPEGSIDTDDEFMAIYENKFPDKRIVREDGGRERNVFIIVKESLIRVENGTTNLNINKLRDASKDEAWTGWIKDVLDKIGIKANVKPTWYLSVTDG